VLVRGVDERLGRRGRFASCTEDRGSDLVLGEHVRETVGAEEEQVVRSSGDREHVGLDRALGPHSPRDRRPLGVALRLLGCENSTLDELGHE
jgi:hypothetical protein